MMLAKNDKIIIIAGVVVLLIAAIGIAMYTSPSVDEDDHITSEEKGYAVTWDTKTSTFKSSEILTIGKNEPYSESYEIDKDNIVSVTVEIEWEDDKTTGIFTKRGLDTLTVDVTCDGKTQSDESKGNGTITFEFANINSIPSEDVIEAEDFEEAEQKIKDEYYLSDYQTIDLDVSVSIGEIRLLKRAGDTGNDIELTITYEYFEPSLMQDDHDDHDDENDDDDDMNSETLKKTYYNLVGLGLVH